MTLNPKASLNRFRVHVVLTLNPKPSLNPFRVHFVLALNPKPSLNHCRVRFVLNSTSQVEEGLAARGMVLTTFKRPLWTGELDLGLGDLWVYRGRVLDLGRGRVQGLPSSRQDERPPSCEKHSSSGPMQAKWVREMESQDSVSAGHRAHCRLELGNAAKTA